MGYARKHGSQFSTGAWIVAISEEMLVTVKRKKRGLFGAKIGATGTGPEAYLLEVQSGPDRSEKVVYLDLRNSRDFYRLPLGVPVRLIGGKVAGRVGWWIDFWELQPSP
jgi:hypothetical protein